MIRAFLVSAALCGMLFATPAQAAFRQRVCHKQFAVVKHHAYVAPVYAQAVTYYQVGSAIREEAIAERAALLALEKFAAALARQPQEPEQPGDVGPVAPSPVKPGFVSDAEIQGIVSADCLRCHQGESAGGGYDLSDVSRLSAEQRTMLWAQVHVGTMPKGGPLLSDEKELKFKAWATGLNPSDLAPPQP